jgi:hypothetical protein
MRVDELFPAIVATCEKVYHCEVVFGVYSPKHQSVAINHLISHEPKKGNGTKVHGIPD